MAAARIAAFALALVSCAALSQNSATDSITVTVTDQSGARIPGARVSVTKIESGVRVDATAGRDGQATLKLETARYRLRVEARGFKPLEEKDVEVNAEIHRTITLAADYDSPPCTSYCDGFFAFIIPDEHPAGDC